MFNDKKLAEIREREREKMDAQNAKAGSRWHIRKNARTEAKVNQQNQLKKYKKLKEIV